MQARPQAVPQTQTSQLIAQCRDEPLIYEGVRPDLCAHLAQIILHRMKAERWSTPSLNVGGRKSPETLFTWPEPAVRELHEAIVSIVGAQPIGWAMVNQRGSHHPRHQHSIARLVGVYYVTCGDENAVTPTIFECAHGELEVEPHPGRLVLSPGSMYHRLPPYYGEEPRISVAFDIRR